MEKKQTNKQTKNILPVKPVVVTLARNHTQVPWLFAVMAQSIFGQFFGYNKKD